MADGPSGDVIDRYLDYENEKHVERLRNLHEGRENAASTVALPQPMEHTPDDANDQGDEMGEGPEEEGGDGPDRAVGFANDHPGSRWTTGDVQITDVRFIDKEGTDTTTFKTNEPFTIRIMYEARKRLENPVFGLALYTQGGVHLNGPNTRFSGVEIPFIEGTGYVDYRIEELPLLSGIYDVTVAVTGAELTDVLDHQHRAYTFNVQPTTGLPERWGLLYMPANWSFHPDPSS